MSKIEINKLTNANVYMNGINLLGRAEEVQLPQIKHKMAEHKALGMVGSAEFFAGIDKLECKIKWNALYPTVMSICSNPFLATMIQVRANLETYNGTGRTKEVPATAFLIGTLSGAVEPIFAVLTLLMFSIISPAMPYLLAFAAGAMLFVVVDELIPEASLGTHNNLSTFSFAIGFCVMMILDVVFG